MLLERFDDEDHMCMYIYVTACMCEYMPVVCETCSVPDKLIKDSARKNHHLNPLANAAVEHLQEFLSPNLFPFQMSLLENIV